MQRSWLLSLQKSKKIMIQALTQCDTIDAGKLREAAEKKRDENILIHIRDKDCVAIEVCYYKTCYGITKGIPNFSLNIRKLFLAKPTNYFARK